MDALRSQRAQAQRVGDGGIDAAADEEEYIAIAGDGADLVFDGRDPAGGSQSCSQPQMSKTKFERIAAARRVHHFGMKLHRRTAARRRAMAAMAQVSVLPGRRNLREPCTTIAMAHPDLLSPPRCPANSGCAVAMIELRESVLAVVAFADAAAQQVRHQLLAVADSEHGLPRSRSRIDGGAAGIVDAGGSAGDDQPLRPRESAAGVSLGTTSA